MKFIQSLRSVSDVFVAGSGQQAYFLKATSLLALLMISSAPGFAQLSPPNSQNSKTANTSQTSKLKSISSMNLEKCFPELADPRFDEKVNLTDLKNQALAMWTLTQTQVLERRVTYKDSRSKRHQIVVTYKPQARGVPLAQAKYFTFDEKDVRIEDELRKTELPSPSMDQVNSILVGMKVESDFSLTEDLFTKGRRSFYRIDRKKVDDLAIEDSVRKVKLQCRQESEGLELCLCKPLL